MRGESRNPNALQRGRLAALALAAAVVALALGAAPEPQAASAPKALSLDYQVLLGPLPIMTVTAEFSLPEPRAAGPYRADIVGRAGGYLGQVYDWSFTARSQGSARGHRLSPKRFEGENLSVLDRRPVTISYSQDGLPAPRFEPPAPEDAGLKPRAADVKGTLDPASAFVALLRTVASSGSCAAAIPVYDGRRRFDLITRASGEELVEALPRSLYGGPAERCEIEVKQLDQSRERLPSSGTAWVAEIAGAPTPVRLELATPAGLVTVDLVKATASPPG